MPLLDLHGAKLIYDNLVSKINDTVTNITNQFNQDIEDLDNKITDLDSYVKDEIKDIQDSVESVSNNIGSGNCDVSLSMFRTIGAIGDSFTAGSIHKIVNGNKIAGSYPELSWAKNIARKDGVSVTLYATSGATSKAWINEYLGKLNSDTVKQLYIVALGINDNTAINNKTYTGGLGTLEDIDSTEELDTFYYYYGKIIKSLQEKIQTARTDSKIVCLSVMRPDERTMDEYIRNVANKLGVPFVDLTEEEFFNTTWFKERLVEAHPTAYMHSGMATAIERAIGKEIINNPDYWKDYTENNKP